MPRVLSVGNSFSQDAQKYLHAVSEMAGEPFSCANLYIGGCSLENHVGNLESGARDYEYEYNGEKTGLKVSLRDALENPTYPFVTLQQNSGIARDYETYHPYFETLAEYVRKTQPNAEIFIHETWAYPKGSERLTALGYGYSWEMHRDVRETTRRIAREAGLRIIPAGDAMMNAMMDKTVAEAGLPLHRDAIHASLTYGRFLLALTWFMTLTGKKPAQTPIPTFSDGTVGDPVLCEALTRAAEKAVRDNGYSLETL